MRYLLPVLTIVASKMYTKHILTPQSINLNTKFYKLVYHLAVELWCLAYEPLDEG